MDWARRPGLLNDVWKYRNGQWTWLSGSSTVNQDRLYGTQGALFPGNRPGGRDLLSGWTDSNGNLWLFGGYGLAGGAEGDLSDLWTYMP
jgi:hypothetical protein